MDILLEAFPGFSSPRQVSQPGKRRRVRTLVTTPPAKSAATEGRSSAELVDDLKPPVGLRDLKLYARAFTEVGILVVVAGAGPTWWVGPAGGV